MITSFDDIFTATTPTFIKFMSVMQYSTMVKRQKTYENEVHHVELLEGIEDTCGGIVVDMIKPMEPGNFIIALRASISQWKEQVINFFDEQQSLISF